MLTFQVSGQKTIGAAAYIFIYPGLTKEKAVKTAVKKEKKGYNCKIKKDDNIKTLAERLKEKYDLIKWNDNVIKLYKREGRGEFKLIKYKTLDEHEANKIKKQLKGAC